VVRSGGHRRVFRRAAAPVQGPEGLFQGAIERMNPYRQERLDGVAVPRDRAKPEATEGGDSGSDQRSWRNLVDSPDLTSLPVPYINGASIQQGSGLFTAGLCWRERPHDLRDLPLPHGES